MSKTYRLGVVLLSAAAVVMMTNSQSAIAQRIKIGGGSDQSSKDKKDKDEDEHKDRKKDRDSNDQNKGNQNSQGNQNNQGGGSSKSEKSDKSNPPTSIQQLIQGGQGKSGQGQNNNQGQGTFNKSGGKNPVGFPTQPFQQQQQQQQQQQIQQFKDKDDDGHHHDGPKFGAWKGDQWQGSHKIDNWSKVFGHNQKPFSSEWYKEHPRAWKYDNHKSNVWVVATVPGVYSWLGWGNVPPQYQVNYNNGPQFDPSLYGEWYPLGVYSLMTGQDDVGTRVLQLAVDRRGRINGNYFDMITDADHGVSGIVDRQTQRAEWSLNQNPNVRFRSSIMRLLQPYGYVTVQLPGGDQRWQFVRLEN